MQITIKYYNIMKKTILTMALVLQCAALFGQTSLNTAVLNPANNESVCGMVRSWTATKAIAYHNYEGTNLFSIIDSSSGTVYSAKVPQSITIRDTVPFSLKVFSRR